LKEWFTNNSKKKGTESDCLYKFVKGSGVRKAIVITDVFEILGLLEPKFAGMMFSCHLQKFLISFWVDKKCLLLVIPGSNCLCHTKKKRFSKYM